MSQTTETETGAFSPRLSLPSPPVFPGRPQPSYFHNRNMVHANVASDTLGINMVIRQDPFILSLDAAALLFSSMCLILAMHYVDQTLLDCFVLVIPLLLLVHNDYENFLRLGPGGTPATMAGYARLTWYRLFILRDPYSPPLPDRTISPEHGILHNIPYRSGPRPLVAGLAPQRQLNQPGSIEAFTAIQTALDRLAAKDSAKFGTAVSCLEKHGFALFSRHPINVCGNGEVCHIHNSDRSMHMNLHPDDIKEILNKGWGQRHPMAWTGWVHTPIPSTFVLIYAARDENDLRIVCKIIEAGIWYTTGEKVDLISLLGLGHRTMDGGAMNLGPQLM